MAIVTIVVGIILAAIAYGGAHIYGGGLHPLAVGVILIVCGFFANTENAKRRKLWMHIAVTIGLLGFLVPGIMSGIEYARWRSTGVATPALALIYEQMLVSAICLAYVAMCVRSFIAARRNRRTV